MNPGRTDLLRRRLPSRIREIHGDLYELLERYRDQYLATAAAFGLINGLDPDAWLEVAHARIAPYVNWLPEREDIVRGERELTRPPFGCLRKGGDCDDWNVVILGGLFRTCHGSEDLQIHYFPNVEEPRHVAVGRKGRVYDLAPPAGIYDLHARHGASASFRYPGHPLNLRGAPHSTPTVMARD